MENSEIYLQAIFSMLGRGAFPPSQLAKIVGRGKQAEAYNMCDGSRTQGEIAASLGINKGNFSKTVGRWSDSGILIKITNAKEIRPLHLYPLPSTGGKEDYADV